MEKVKQIEIKNINFYFYNDMINLQNFESKLFKIDKNVTGALVFTTLDRLQF